MARYQPKYEFGRMPSYTPSMEGLGENALVAAEKELGLKFDQELRAYLLDPVLEEGEGALYEYVGLNSTRPDLNIVTATQEAREGVRNGMPPYPTTAVLIAHQGNGDSWFWDISRKKIGLYSHDNPRLEYPSGPNYKNLQVFRRAMFKV